MAAPRSGELYNVSQYTGWTWPTNRNAFQLVMIDRSDRGAGDFDFWFNYDYIQWDGRRGQREQPRWVRRHFRPCGLVEWLDGRV